jgi:hypothetical protein
MTCCAVTQPSAHACTGLFMACGVVVSVVVGVGCPASPAAHWQPPAALVARSLAFHASFQCAALAVASRARLMPCCLVRLQAPHSCLLPKGCSAATSSAFSTRLQIMSSVAVLCAWCEVWAGQVGLSLDILTKLLACGCGFIRCRVAARLVGVKGLHRQHCLLPAACAPASEVSLVGAWQCCSEHPRAICMPLMSG